MEMMNKRGYNCQEAAQYLGIKRRAFEKHFRPFLTGASIGTSVIFDRFDLDRVLEEHIQRNGRPVEKGGITWAELKPASTRTSRAFQHYHKLVTTQTGHGVTITHAGHQTLRNLLQEQITNFMAERVV